MRVALAAAVAALVLACGNKDTTAPKTRSAGSAEAGSAAPGAGSAGVSDPWSGSSAGSSAGSAAPAPDAPCNDDDIKKRIEAGLGESAAYLAALEKKVARWNKDCAAATKDLLALEPDAKRFMDSMMAFATWGRTLSEACRKRVEELGEQHPITSDLEKRTPALEDKVTPMIERCKDHPGFQEAAAKGLRVMRRKSAAP